MGLAFIEFLCNLWLCYCTNTVSTVTSPLVFKPVLAPTGPPLKSNGQGSWLQIQRSGLDSRRYKIFREVVGLERGSLSFVRTTEELLGRKSCGSGLETREYGRRGSVTLTTWLGRYSSLADSDHGVFSLYCITWSEEPASRPSRIILWGTTPDNRHSAGLDDIEKRNLNLTGTRTSIPRPSIS
jgi:hypothetical protein